MENKNTEEENSDYCSLCSSCGEEGCCKASLCFSALIKNTGCKYGKGYLKDVQFDKEVADLGFELFNKLKERAKDNENGGVFWTLDDLILFYSHKWDCIHDKTYQTEKTN